MNRTSMSRTENFRHVHSGQMCLVAIQIMQRTGGQVAGAMLICVTARQYGNEFEDPTRYSMACTIAQRTELNSLVTIQHGN